MTLSEVITFALDNIIPVLLIAIILYLLVRRLYKTARQHLGMKSYLKSAEKLDRKKFNGIELVDKIRRKRKRHTNTFKHLRGRAKKRVRQYFTHKSEELPVVVRYAKGKMFKRSRNRLIITITDGRKTLKKTNFKKGIRPLIEVTNEYECLDEMVAFLHYLPQVLLQHDEYDMPIGNIDASISYYIK